MTQEELDALMAGDLDEEMALMDAEEETDTANDVKVSEELSENTIENEDGKIVIDEKNFKVDATKQWPPPPPTEDHKVVNQLDNVTRDSEKKATEIMDKLEEINNYIMDIESDGNEAIPIVQKNIDTFTKLGEKFPNIAVFNQLKEDNSKLETFMKEMIEKSQYSADEIMMIMDIMQYQDIHRQKIERVINVMRALSKYMNSLFASDIDDAQRVSSAVHIDGDKETDDLVDNAEIEALLASFGQK